MEKYFTSLLYRKFSEVSVAFDLLWRYDPLTREFIFKSAYPYATIPEEAKRRIEFWFACYGCNGDVVTYLEK